MRTCSSAAVRVACTAIVGGLYSSPCSAAPSAEQIELRVQAGAASFISRDQVDWLGYDGLGIVGAIQLGYGLLPWLELRVSMLGVGFPSELNTGALVAPQLGAALRLPSPLARPWLQVDIGAGRTGAFLKPVLSVSVGIDLTISRSFALGPVLGYSQVFHHDSALATTDACFLWFGVALAAHPWASEPQPEVVIQDRQHLVERVTVVQREPPTSPPGPALDAELETLLNSASAVARREWLAPVLFALGSAELEPQGLAMLHEVAHELQTRSDIKLVEIQGYSDARGPKELNLRLSEQRANVVLEWLVAHHIARARLRVAPMGAIDFVEQGQSEDDHAQNRRVVFRVLEEGTDKP